MLFSVVDGQKLKKPKKWKNKEEERQILPSGQQGENSAKSWLFTSTFKILNNGHLFLTMSAAVS